ncbi:MAG: hypothetical protein P8X57_10865, partial [Cyclobacteriaceae bacterium]
LLDQNVVNHKLFYIRSGKIIGLLPDKHTTEPVFEADADSFVGVYSYLSEDHRSYSRLIATEETTVCYYDDDPRELPFEDAEKFLGFLFRIVVLELRSRQYYAAQMAHERQEVMNKLIKTEKLATLGQLSTGLAHELNNSIGSLSANLRQLQNELRELLIDKKSSRMQAYFQRGLEEGLLLSSKEARSKREEWEGVRGFDQQTIKKLSKAGIHPETWM